jgi:hypothetical protein
VRVVINGSDVEMGGGVAAALSGVSVVAQGTLVPSVACRFRIPMRQLPPLVETT